MKKKLNKLWRTHHPKTIEFWEAAGLSAEAIDALVNAECERSVYITNKKLAILHRNQEPEQIKYV